jgi:hypothetical protein
MNRLLSSNPPRPRLPTNQPQPTPYCFTWDNDHRQTAPSESRSRSL